MTGLRPTITRREQDVLESALQGKTDKEIAEFLGITSHAVRFHWRNIFRKLETGRRIQAVTKALQIGLTILPKLVGKIRMVLS